MLNDADGYGSGSGEVKDADALFTRLKSQVKADYNSRSQVNWRKEAREDFDFGRTTQQDGQGHSE